MIFCLCVTAVWVISTLIGSGDICTLTAKVKSKSMLGTLKHCSYTLMLSRTQATKWNFHYLIFVSLEISQKDSKKKRMTPTFFKKKSRREKQLTSSNVLVKDSWLDKLDEMRQPSIVVSSFIHVSSSPRNGPEYTPANVFNWTLADHP